MIATYMVVANLLVAAGIAVVYYLEWRKVRDKPWAWVLAAYAVVGVYWSVLYLTVLFAPDGFFNPVLFGRIYVRPALLVTLSIVLAAALIGREK